MTVMGVAVLMVGLVSLTACAELGDYGGGYGYTPSYVPSTTYGSSFSYGCGDCGRGRHHHRRNDDHHRAHKHEHKKHDHKHHHHGGNAGGGSKKEHKKR